MSTSDQEQQALEAFWVKENGLVIAHRKVEMTTALVDQGREISGRSCIECHAPNTSAFVSYGLAKITGPIAAAAGDAGAVNFLWYLHILFCLSFLAWLPFSKMFHIIAAPVSLIDHPDHGQGERRTGQCPDPADDRPVGLHPLRRLQP